MEGEDGPEARVQGSRGITSGLVLPNSNVSQKGRGSGGGRVRPWQAGDICTANARA